MKSLLTPIRKLLVRVADRDANHEETYLSAAEDMHDLEYRIRELDRRRRDAKPFSHLRLP